MDLTHTPAKLCILKKWPHYDGYGFDLVTKKSGGHFISVVHPGGPAEATNLQQGDWLIEVNYVNVEKFGHSQVIKAIKESAENTVKMLLVPPMTEKWRRRHRMVIRSSHPDLKQYFTPDPENLSKKPPINGRSNIAKTVSNGNRHGEMIEESIHYHRYSMPEPNDKEKTTQICDKENIQKDDSISDLNGYPNVSKGHGNHCLVADVEDHQVLRYNGCNEESRKELQTVTADIRSTTIENEKGSHVTTITILDHEFSARRCKVQKHLNSKDFGFKLDSLAQNGGHFLRDIDPNGPAAQAGIMENDRLIEVNNVNVEYTNHQNLVNMIRNSPNQVVTLLVADKQTYEWFQSRNIRIHHGASSLIKEMSDEKQKLNPLRERTNSFQNLRKNGTRSALIYSNLKLDQKKEEDNQEKTKKKIQIIQMPQDAPCPRIATIHRQRDQRFGFTLNTYQKDGVKLIAEVEPDSPAFFAGLRQWDRLIEINGINVLEENHSGIKERIEEAGERLELMVIADNEFEWYETRKFVPKNNQSNTIYCTNESQAKGNITRVSQYVNSLNDASPKEVYSKVSLVSKLSLNEVGGVENTKENAKLFFDFQQSNGHARKMEASNSSSTSQTSEDGQSSQLDLKQGKSKSSGEEQFLGKLRRLSAKELRSKLPTNKRQAYEISSNLAFEEKIEFFNNL